MMSGGDETKLYQYQFNELIWCTTTLDPKGEIAIGMRAWHIPTPIYYWHIYQYSV